MVRVVGIVFLFISILLGGCTQGAVVFAPTPLPPELAPTAYTHSSGAFTLLLPGNWSRYEQDVDTFAAASFSPPGSSMPLVEAFAINIGNEIRPDLLDGLLTLYQTQFRPDLAQYTEQSREAMGDGSWRITGLRRRSSGETLQINTFFQWEGSTLGILEVVLATDASWRTQTQTIINTFALEADASLPNADLSLLSGASWLAVEVVNISTWTTLDGVFFVTGEVTNHSEYVLTDIPVRVILKTADGDPVADALDMVMGYAVEPDGFAPFSIRFGQGQPVNALNYTVLLGSEMYRPQDEAEVISAPDLVWTDETQYTLDGALFVTGTISNRGSQDVALPRAVVTVFDEHGRVIAAGFADADDAYLPVNGETAYTILISDLGGIAANYLVNVQGLPCDMTNCP